MLTFLKPRYHKILIKILLFISLVNCQFQDPYLNHGINFLDNRAKKLIVSKSNLNDVVRIMGHPHTKSFSNENQWVYIERTLTKGEYHKLGKNVLKNNNVLILEFNKYGILSNKKLYDKNDLKKIKFSNQETKNEITQKSFVEKFLTSVKNKMYGNRK